MLSCSCDTPNTKTASLDQLFTVNTASAQSDVTETRHECRKRWIPINVCKEQTEQNKSHMTGDEKKSDLQTLTFLETDRQTDRLTDGILICNKPINNF